MANRNATDDSNSRYTQGGSTDRFEDRLGWWDRRTLARDDSDIVHVITDRQRHRPDLIAYDVYGRRDLMWLVLQYNNILDVADEIVAGREIVLPTFSRVIQEILGQPVGGVEQ